MCARDDIGDDQTVMPPQRADTVMRGHGLADPPSAPTHPQ